MKARIFVVLESVFLGVGLLVFTPPVNPTSVGKVSNPPQVSTSLQDPTPPFLTPSGTTSQPKPLAVWECVTSWYGEEFDGQPTATGETYDMYAITAAHPTLPLGSIIRIVNVRNQRSQVVRINDRGPYIEGRELDVSYEVARRLGFDERGLAKVRLELLEVPSHPVQYRRD